MRNNKIFKAIAVAAPVLLSATAMGQIISGNVNFTTVQDVTITEGQLVDFGATIIPIAGRSCTLTATLTDNTASAEVVTATVAGSACDNAATDALGGEYALSGANSSQVTITLSQNDTTTDYTYDPAGTYSDNGTDTPIATATPLTVTLSATGRGFLALGGTLSIVNDLSFNLPFADTFDIEVTY